MDCRDASKFVALRVDGEIDERDCADLERHLESCPFCQRRWEAEQHTQERLRKKLQESISSPDFQIPAALKAKIVDSGRAEVQYARRPLVMGVPVAACVALAAVAVIVPEQSEEKRRAHRMTDRTVQRHSANLPSEVNVTEANIRNLESFFSRHLAFPVRVPAQKRGPKLIGARLSHIERNDVAYLMYDHRGARISLFAFPRGRGLSTVPGHRLSPRTDAIGRSIFVGQERGYNVVSWTGPSADYALVSEIDVQAMIGWSAELRTPRHPRQTPRKRRPFRRGVDVRTVSHQR